MLFIGNTGKHVIFSFDIAFLELRPLRGTRFFELLNPGFYLFHNHMENLNRAVGNRLGLSLDVIHGDLGERIIRLLVFIE